jgi:glutamine synthetase
VADALHRDGSAFEVAPRHVLKRMLARYAEMGWQMLVAPELEFYLTEVNSDPDLPIQPPRGRSGRASSPQPYGLESVTEYEDIIEEIYDNSEIASLQLDTMIHEGGTAQLEINFNHGDPVALCDQVVIFKRIVRQVALKHGVYATFMAKPMESQPGSAMHLHISAVDGDGNNLFGTQAGLTQEFRWFVGGMQRYLPQVVRCSRPTSIPSAASARPTARRSTCNGASTTAVAACASRSVRRATPASKTACRAPMPIPISPSPPRWPAAISA